MDSTDTAVRYPTCLETIFAFLWCVVFIAVGDELVSAGVARIEKLLATGGQSICATTSDDKDIHDLSADSSHDQVR